MDLRCEFRKNKCCIYLPEVPQTERKGRKDGSESARRTGLRLLGPVQKTGMENVHLVVHKHFRSMAEQQPFKLTYVGSIPANATISQRVYGFRKENQLIALENEHT